MLRMQMLIMWKKKTIFYDDQDLLENKPLEDVILFYLFYFFLLLFFKFHFLFSFLIINCVTWLM